MNRSRPDSRGYSRTLAIGIVTSAAVHAAVLGLVRWERSALTEREVTKARSEASAERWVERPLEVVQLRATAEARESSPARRARTAPPARVAIPAALAAALPTPRLLLAKVETVEKERTPVAAYASVEDLLIRRGPNPKALRPIDDRPIEVLAAIARAEAGRGGGIRIGGGGGTCE